MDLNFSSFIDFTSSYFFNGSTSLAGLALLMASWAVCAVICMNFKASPAYSIAPMIPLAIMFSAFGILNETVMIVIVLVCSILVATEFKKVVD